MLKRTKGRVLITLLVITGLAGTLNNSTLSQKERKQAITLIKSSRADLLNTVNGLSAKQFNFKASPGDASIGELVISMVSLEKACSEQLRSLMDLPAEPEDRLKITLTDEQLLDSPSQGLCNGMSESVSPDTPEDSEDALKKFVAMRNNSIKYIRNSTEDLRNHVVNTPSGWIDCYQYYLLLAHRSSYFAEKINQIKSVPGFPKN